MTNEVRHRSVSAALNLRHNMKPTLYFKGSFEHCLYLIRKYHELIYKIMKAEAKGWDDVPPWLQYLHPSQQRALNHSDR